MHRLLQFDLVSTKIYNKQTYQGSSSTNTIWLLNQNYLVFDSNLANQPPIAISGTAKNDRIVVYNEGSGLAVSVNGNITHYERGAPLNISANAGDDLVSIELIAGLAAVPITVSGGAGNDTILTAGGNDRIDAGEGDDVVVAGGGKNTVYGGAGNDALSGGSRIDLLDGGDGIDALLGNGGEDHLLNGES
jgi:Ca2+-binding RTX toxin-like protein